MDKSSITPRPQPFKGENSTAMRWLRKFKAYSAALGVKDDKALNIFYMLMEGPAEDWFDSLKEDEKASMKDIYTAFENRYGSLNDIRHPDFLQQFQERTQGPNEAALDYIAAMVAAASHSGLEDNFLKSFIIKGLRPQIRKPVRQQNPATIEELKTVAKQVEAAEEDRSTDTTELIAILTDEVRRLRTDQSESRKKRDQDDADRMVAATSTDPQSQQPGYPQPALKTNFQQQGLSHQHPHPDSYPQASYYSPPHSCYPPPHSYPPPQAFGYTHGYTQPQGYVQSQWNNPVMPSEGSLFLSHHNPRPQFPRRLPRPTLPCKGCGGNGHYREQCKAFSQTCRNCNKVGHFASVCRSGRGRGSLTSYTSRSARGRQTE